MMKELIEDGLLVRPELAGHVASGKFGVIRSQHGLARQPKHRDVRNAKVQEVLAKGWLAPLSVIVVLHDHHMTLWPGAIGGVSGEGAPTRVLLKAGSAIAFRGDLVHCGPGHMDSPVVTGCTDRIHLHLDDRRRTVNLNPIEKVD